jgi:flagellar biosynthesis protein FlhG
MRDQAAGLRSLETRRPQPAAPETTADVIVIGSGKGGVGKSVLSAWIAAGLARSGRRVLLLDGAQDQGNLHLLLDVRPAGTLASVLAGSQAPEDLVVPVEERLWLMPADTGGDSLHALPAVDRARLHYRLSGMYDEFDAVIVDSGAGLESVVRASTIRAGRLVVVAIPEPAALSDAYAVIKLVHHQSPTLPMDVIVNRVMADDEGAGAFERLRLASERFLGRSLRYLGAVPEDATLRARVREAGALLGAIPPRVAAMTRQLATGPATIAAGEGAR